MEQLQRLDGENPEVKELNDLVDQARKKRREKRHFVEQLTHDTLKRANEHLGQRHYVLAIEVCDKVLKVDPEHQDAKVIKANAIRKLEQFLARVKGKS